MKRISFSAALLAFALPLLGAGPATVSIPSPPDTVAFKSAPGVALATGNCQICHSAAYVYTQPRLTRAQWTAEVNKMRTVYGAPVPPTDVPGIVDYLMTQNGKKG